MRGALVIALVLVAGCRDGCKGGLAGKPVDPSAWQETGIANAHVLTAGPLSGGGFFIGGSRSSKAWLVRVDRAGKRSESTYPGDWISAVTEDADGTLAIAGGAEKAGFVARLGPDGVERRRWTFPADVGGSELDATVIAGDRIIAAGVHNPLAMGRTEGWLVSGADREPTWEKRIYTYSFSFLLGLAANGEDLVAVGGKNTGGEHKPWLVTVRRDGTDLREEVVEGRSFVTFDHLVVHDGHPVIVGTDHHEAFVQEVGPDRKLGARRMTGIWGGTLSRPVSTAGGIAFTFSTSDESGSTVVHVGPGGVRTARVDPPGMLDLRHPSTVVLGVNDGRARVLHVRSERGELAHRVVELALEPAAPAPR